jgi:hypothetical protein
MEKRYVLKKWVHYLLMTVMGLCFIVFASDCDNTVVFIASKVIAVIVALGCNYLLETQGDLERL